MVTEKERIKRADKIIKVFAATEKPTQWLSDASGVAYSTVWRVVNVKQIPRLGTIVLLERALGLDR